MSLRLRLLLAVGAVAIGALVAADVATYSLLRSSLLTRVDQSLEAAHIPVEEAFHSGRPLDIREVGSIAPGLFLELRDPSGGRTDVPAFVPGGKSYTPKLPARLPALTASSGHDEGGEPHRYFTVGAVEHGGPQLRVRVSDLASGYTLILATPLSEAATTLHRLINIELAVTAAALAAAALVGWWLVRLGLQPLAAVERTAEAIADGELDQRVPVANERTEVGRLATTVNKMLGRIESAFAARDATEAELRRSEERLRQFIADASHELRTPIAAVAAYAELFERGARERPEDLARLLTGIRTETGRMGHLVEDLLLLARLDEGRPLERKPVDLVALAGESVETAATVGPAWPVDLRATQPVEVVGDSLRLRQVIDNLLANVRAHTPSGTAAHVVVTATADEVMLTVSDNGPGMTDDQAAHVFERFYRADPSRSRRYGGAGLGLGIVAAIVAAHGGRVGATATPGGGSTFTVTLPRPEGSGQDGGAEASHELGELGAL